MSRWFDQDMESSGESRVAAARARALTAKTVVGVGALGAFALFALLARASHASNQTTHAATTGGLHTPQSFLTALQQQQSNDSLGGGQIAPPDQAPQVQSGTS